MTLTTLFLSRMEEPTTKRDRVRLMFDDIAPTYDRLNHVLSFNIDRLWRRRVVRIVRRAHRIAGGMCRCRDDRIRHPQFRASRTRTFGTVPHNKERRASRYIGVLESAQPACRRAVPVLFAPSAADYRRCRVAQPRGIRVSARFGGQVSGTGGVRPHARSGRLHRRATPPAELRHRPDIHSKTTLKNPTLTTLKTLRTL